MRQETINLYQYDELSEDAQKHVLQELYDINVDGEWWDSVFDDAKQIGLRITSFDLSHRQKITGELLLSVGEIVRNIIDNHGKDCDTYSLAKGYYRLRKLNSKKSYYDKTPLSEETFKELLLTEYLSMLRNDYEYLTSEEAIIDTIRANEYEFTKDGRMY